MEPLGKGPEPGARDVDLPAPAAHEPAHGIEQVALHRDTEGDGGGVDVVLPQVLLDACLIGRAHQPPEHRLGVDPGHGGEQRLQDAGVGLGEPGGHRRGENAFEHQEPEGFVAMRGAARASGGNSGSRRSLPPSR